MGTRNRIGSVLDWCGAYVLISFISYFATVYPAWRDWRVQTVLMLVLIATLGLNRMARASSRRRGYGAEAVMPLAFLLVASWLLQLLALDVLVHLRTWPGEGYWRGWWSRDAIEVLGYVPLFILAVWSDLVWRPGS